MVQTSFTLPVPPGPEGRGRRAAAGAQDGHRAGDGRAQPRASASGYTFFVVYGSVQHLVDLDAVVVEERAYPLLASSEINGAIRTGLRRKLVVLGACIGTDAHTVGIDAILNVKGFAGEKGLEYLREMAVTNLGAQVTVPGAGREGPRRAGRRRPRLPGGHPEGRAPAQHPRAGRRLPRGDGGVPPAAGRRRPPVRPGDGRRPRRRQGLRPGDDARRGRQLPRPRPRPREEQPHDRPPARPDRHPPPLRAATRTPTTAAPWSTAPTPSACSATSPPRWRS